MDPGTSNFFKKCTGQIFTKCSSVCHSCANTHIFHPFCFSGMEIPGGKHLNDSDNPVMLWTQCCPYAYPVILAYFSQIDALPALCAPVAYKVCNDLCLKQQILWLGERNSAAVMKSGLPLVISAEPRRADQQLTVNWCCFNRFTNIPSVLFLRAKTHFSYHCLEGKRSWRDSFSTPVNKDHQNTLMLLKTSNHCEHGNSRRAIVN